MLVMLIAFLSVACTSGQDSTSLLLLDNAGPRFTKSLHGSVVSGTVVVELNNVRGVEAVDYLLDTRDLTTEPAHTASVAPYTFELDTTALTDGGHSLLAASSANSITAARVLAEATFTVANASPPPPGGG